MSLQELQSLLLKIRKPEVCNHPPCVEKEQTAKVENMTFWDVLVQRELEQTYLGKRIKKAFRMRVNWEFFEGKITEVWYHEEQGYFLRVEYEDGDTEDMSLGELESLLRDEDPREAGKTNEVLPVKQSKMPSPSCENGGNIATDVLQWPVFEVTKEDLLFFSNYHDASVQASRKESAIVGNKAAVDACTVKNSKDIGEHILIFCGIGMFAVLVLLLFPNKNLRGSVELCSVPNFHSELQSTSTTSYQFHDLTNPTSFRPTLSSIHLWGKTNYPPSTTPKPCVSLESCSSNFLRNYLYCCCILFWLHVFQVYGEAIRLADIYCKLHFAGKHWNGYIPENIKMQFVVKSGRSFAYFVFACFSMLAFVVLLVCIWIVT